MNFRMSAKPRRKVGNQWQSGNQYTAWDLTGTPSVQFSPDLQQQLMAGIAEVDTGSTDSSWMQTEVKQNYFQADVTKLFEAGWLTRSSSAPSTATARSTATPATPTGVPA